MRGYGATGLRVDACGRRSSASDVDELEQVHDPTVWSTRVSRGENEQPHTSFSTRLRRLRQRVDGFEYLCDGLIVPFDFSRTDDCRLIPDPGQGATQKPECTAGLTDQAAHEPARVRTYGGWYGHGYGKKKNLGRRWCSPPGFIPYLGADRAVLCPARSSPVSSDHPDAKPVYGTTAAKTP